MSGFELRRQERVLYWPDDHDLHGLEATVSLDTPTDLLLRIRGFGEGSIEVQRELMIAFGDAVLVAWNLTVDGQPVPADGAGMIGQPLRVVNALMEAYGNVVAGDAPLDLPSAGITGSAGPSIQTASG